MVRGERVSALAVTALESMSQNAPARVPDRVRDRNANDAPIVEGLRRGDRAAFDAAYGRYRSRVYAFLLRLSGRVDVSEDLFQETWLKLARHAPRLEEDTDLAAWLFAVARNAWVSHRRWSMLDVSRLVALGEETAPAAWRVSGPEDRADASRRVANLERALAGLSPGLREVLLLVGVEGFEQERAARILGISYDALRQRLARARAQLAERLELDEEVPA
jgi:RNA polymerase sigma-70 factor (ECF subfamily)